MSPVVRWAQTMSLVVRWTQTMSLVVRWTQTKAIMTINTSRNHILINISIIKRTLEFKLLLRHI